MDKRKEPRRDYFSRAQIEGVDDVGLPFRMNGMIEDRSNSGFGIRVKNPIPAGSEIKIQQAGKTYSAIVRHCARYRDTYFLGVELMGAADKRPESAS